MTDHYVPMGQPVKPPVVIAQPVAQPFMPVVIPIVHQHVSSTAEQAAQAVRMQQAFARIRARRRLLGSLMSFFIVNTCFWVMWWYEHRESSSLGYPWPMWISFGMGIMLFWHVWAHLVTGLTPTSRSLANSVGVYVQVNMIIWALWFMTTYYSTHSFTPYNGRPPWPVWVSAPTTVMLGLRLLRHYSTRSIGADELRREMLRGQP